MARKYQVQGTKTFLFWCVVLLALGLWGLKDGWFPSESKLLKHADPDDSFWMFNKTLAVLCLTGSAVCGYIHRVVR